LTLNVAYLLGTGYAGEDVFQKEPVARGFAQARTHFASRIDPEVHLADDELPVRFLTTAQLRAAYERARTHGAGFEVVHRSPHLQRRYAEAELRELEAWLGVSFDFVTSMDRRFFDSASLQDRRDPHALAQYLAGLVSFFRDFYGRQQVDVLLTTLEDDTFSLAGYFVAKRMGLDVFATLVSRVPRRGLMLVRDFRDLLEWNADLPPWSTLERLYPAQLIHGEILRRTKGYWDLQSFPRRAQEAFFAGSLSRWRDRVVAAYPQEALIVPPLRLGREAWRYASKVARRYLSGLVTQAPEGGERYFLYALHYTDDAQITFREPYLNQFQLIKDIHRALPRGAWLYVKPHPHYHGTDLSVGEMRKLRRFPKLRLVPAMLPPAPLIRGARAVVTVNSTVGFEALVHGTPVVTLGTDFYCHEPPCRVVHDRNRLARTLAEIDAAREAHDPAVGREFVRRVYANTIPVDGVDFGPGLYGFTDEDGRRIAAAVERSARAPRPSQGPGPA
jgi:capsular polysaccharide biosynthesis protein